MLMLSNSKIMTSSSKTKIRLILPSPIADGLKSDSLNTSSLGGAVTETTEMEIQYKKLSLSATLINRLVVLVDVYTYLLA